MNLDLFNNLINSTKENKFIQSFIKELGEFLENNTEKPLTARYRDEINIKRHEIVNNYSKEISPQEELYYIYTKNYDNTYGIVMHENGETGRDFCVKESQVPKGAEVDSVLRKKNGKFILDKTATEKIQQELGEMKNRLLKEQDNRLNTQRVEGHIYKFVEKTGDSAWLIDETNYTGEVFQEIDFPNELLDKATQGDFFQYANGEYHVYKN